jgi:hypothetical protein
MCSARCSDGYCADFFPCETSHCGGCIQCGASQNCVQNTGTSSGIAAFGCHCQ